MFKAQFLSDEFLRSANTPATEPPKDSFFWKAFNENNQVAYGALNTAFIQGIKVGNLSPTQYGAFTVLDAYYCYMGSESYGIAYNKAQDSELKAILKENYERYVIYNEVFLKTWHISDYNSVVPTNTIKCYADIERNIALLYNSIYTLVVMLPCYWLWYWLSDKLYQYRANNLYAFWIEGNHFPNSAYFIGNYIDKWQKQGNEFDEGLALNMYKDAMMYEYKNLYEACLPNLLEGFFR